MRAGSYGFTLTLSSLWHWLQGGTRLIFGQGISILRLVMLLDVSKWQGTIDFHKMKFAGCKGVIIKCGQGAGIDPRFTQNWARAKQAGIPRGSYWFYDSRQAPKAQAYTWWNWIKTDPGELMHFADYEENYKGDYAGWKNFKIFLQEFQKLSGLPAKKIGIYTGYYYWIAHSPASTAELSWFGQFDLWLAWYTDDPKRVLIPKPWTNLVMWQWGTPAYGGHYGVESIEVDHNWFNGDDVSYRMRFGLSLNDPPIDVEPPAPDPETDEGDDFMAITDEGFKYFADKLYAGLLAIADAVKGSGTGSGGGTTPPPSTAKESVYQVQENDPNPNGRIKIYKVPDTNETNTDVIDVKTSAGIQTLRVINSWTDVPPGLVYWNALSDLDKMNTYDQWKCVHQNWIYNVNGVRREFPNIMLQQGTVRAEYCWVRAADLGAKVG
jgi:lysozyme